MNTTAQVRNECQVVSNYKKSSKIRRANYQTNFASSLKSCQTARKCLMNFKV